MSKNKKKDVARSAEARTLRLLLQANRERPFFSDVEIAKARRRSTTMFMKEKTQRQFQLH